MQDARSVGTDLDAGTDFAQRSRAFIDMHVQARTKEREGRGQAANAPADDCDRGLGLPHGVGQRLTTGTVTQPRAARSSARRRTVAGASTSRVAVMTTP